MGSIPTGGSPQEARNLADSGPSCFPPNSREGAKWGAKVNRHPFRHNMDMATTCTGCGGEGYVEVPRGTTNGQTVYNKETCKRCGGSGTDPSRT